MNNLISWAERALGWADGNLTPPVIDEMHAWAWDRISARRLDRFHRASARLKMCKEALATRPLNGYEFLGASEHLKAAVHVSYPGCGYDGYLIELQLKQSSGKGVTIGVFRTDELTSSAELLAGLADSIGMVTDDLKEGMKARDYPGK